jgi:photosystem II stability/assembly factor-like uncharacterized protein
VRNFGRLNVLGWLVILAGCDTVVPAPDWYSGLEADGGGQVERDAGEPDAGGPKGAWVNVTQNLANMPSSCGNLSVVAAKPDEDVVFAGVNSSGLWASRNGGESWEQQNQGESAMEFSGNIVSFVFDPANASQFWLTTIYGERGVYRTQDAASTFAPRGNVRHNDSLSVDLSDPERKLQIAGGHERAQNVSRTDDGGETWREIGAKLPADKACTYPLILGATTFLVGCNYTGEGIYRTTDGGLNWSWVSTIGGAAAPLATDEGIFWSASNGALLRSEDDGETWNEVTPRGLLKPGKPILLPDGRLAASAYQGRLDGVVVSSDLGKTWRAVSVAFPARPDELTYSTQRKAFFMRHADCGEVVLENALARFDWDFEAD